MRLWCRLFHGKFVEIYWRPRPEYIGVNMLVRHCFKCGWPPFEPGIKYTSTTETEAEERRRRIRSIGE